MPRTTPPYSFTTSPDQSSGGVGEGSSRIRPMFTAKRGGKARGKRRGRGKRRK